MIIMYDIFYKDEADGFKEIHFHSRVAYSGTATRICEKLEAEGKKPWFHHVKID